MWDNEDWASRHLKKRHPGISTKDAWDVVFNDAKRVAIKSPDQLRWPPFFRYWTIGKTKNGQLLFVVWEVARGKFHLVTAFPPDKERISLYERLKKKERN